ncbi:MAG: isoleucine--tRNA ligase [Polyangiaceae bacterium]|nr:isoleucine--tRNA ligase [Polyangiaceae bacterium]
MRYREVPAKLDLPALEQRTLKFWEEERSFEKLREKNRGKPPWSFLDGPITANNPMGVHHAWGRSYKDMFNRYNAMLGRELRYQNGFDCQGLWVEVEVEKELKFKSKRDIEQFGIAEFVEKCKERARRFAAVQTQQSIRLGYWMDWSNSYYTMSDENNYTIWAFLKKCHERGWVYKGTDVMPWCGRCGTGLSQHEIATEGYREITHLSPYVRFRLKDRPGESLLAWTTTPWTLTSNVAAAVHPDKTYLKVKQGNEIVYVMEAREQILKEKGAYEIIDRIKGAALEGLTYESPFADLPAQKDVVHKVVAWTEVLESDGTGVVHIAPGCGKEDFQLGKERGLAVVAPLDELGQFLPGFGPFTGRAAGEVAQDVVAMLKERGMLYKREDYKHSYPVCWRCSSEVVFRLVDEWFISMGEKLDKPDDEVTPEEKAQNLRYQIIDSAKQARWIPGYGLDRELDWLHNMEHWMISKKRYWGLALPIFICEGCGQFDVVGGREELKERAVAGWAEFEGNSPHRPWIDGVKIKCSKCNGIANRIKDVGNPWLDAGIVGFSTMNYSTDRDYWAKWFPAELVTESFPGQFRNWFYSILAMSTVLAGRAPFKTLFGYALMKAEDGREMHKSWGNAIEFNEAANKEGVDAMRWLYASHIPDQNLLFGYKSIAEARKKLITLWNVYSFFVTYANVDNFDPSSAPVPLSERNVLDRWILGSLQRLVAAAHDGYQNYHVHTFMRHTDRFLEDLSNWYVRRSRRRFWKSEAGSDKTAAYQTLYEVLVTLCEILAPVLPFVTEEMYQNLVRNAVPGSEESVHHRAFPTAKGDYIDEALAKRMDILLEVVERGRQAREEAKIKIRQPLQTLVIKLPEGTSPKDLADLEPQIFEELNVKAIEYRDDVATLLELGVSANSKKIGPRFGKDAQKVFAALKKLTAGDLSHYREGSPLDLTIDTGTVTLGPDEVNVRKAAVKGWSLGDSPKVQVLISTEVTTELKYEGLVREAIRAIQDLRKTSGLHVADRITLTLDSTPVLRAAIEANMDMLKRETLALQVVFGNAGEKPLFVEMDEENVKISLVASANIQA